MKRWLEITGQVTPYSDNLVINTAEYDVQAGTIPRHRLTEVVLEVLKSFQN